MVDFSSCRSVSPDSCTSSTFCLVPPSWNIFLYMGQVLLTHASYAYLTLRLRHGIFFFKWVGFLDSRTLNTFCLMPLQRLISLHTGRVLFTHVPWAYFVLCLCRSGFCFTRVEFYRLTHLRHIWPYAFTMTDFFSCWSGFSNSSALDTLCLVPPPWPISPCVYWVFPTCASRAHFALHLSCDGFFFTWVRFSWLIRLKHIWFYTYVVVGCSLHKLSFPNSCVSSTFSLMPLLW